MNQKILKQLKEQLRSIEYYNNLAPFNVYGAEYIEDIKNKIMELNKEDKVNYDNEPVVACKYCKSLHIITDDKDNTICMRCETKNELVEFENIYQYKEFLLRNGK